jgi:hypothetical protein
MIHSSIPTLQQISFMDAEMKGWHRKYIRDADGSIHVAQLLALLALAHREECENSLEPAHFYYSYKGKPEGKIIELADVVIRLLDAAEVCGFEYRMAHAYPVNLHNAISEITECARVDGVNADTVSSALYDAVHCAYAVAESIGYPEKQFEYFIDLKQAFNRTRPDRHGDKRA